MDNCGVCSLYIGGRALETILGLLGRIRSASVLDGLGGLGLGGLGLGGLGFGGGRGYPVPVPVPVPAGGGFNPGGFNPGFNPGGFPRPWVGPGGNLLHYIDGGTPQMDTGNLPLPASGNFNRPPGPVPFNAPVAVGANGMLINANGMPIIGPHGGPVMANGMPVSPLNNHNLAYPNFNLRPSGGGAISVNLIPNNPLNVNPNFGGGNNAIFIPNANRNPNSVLPNTILIPTNNRNPNTFTGGVVMPTLPGGLPPRNPHPLVFHPGPDGGMFTNPNFQPGDPNGGTLLYVMPDAMGPDMFGGQFPFNSGPMGLPPPMIGRPFGFGGKKRSDANAAKIDGKDQPAETAGFDGATKGETSAPVPTLLPISDAVDHLMTLEAAMGELSTMQETPLNKQVLAEAEVLKKNLQSYINENPQGPELLEKARIQAAQQENQTDTALPQPSNANTANDVAPPIPAANSPPVQSPVSPQASAYVIGTASDGSSVAVPVAYAVSAADANRAFAAATEPVGAASLPQPAIAGAAAAVMPSSNPANNFQTVQRGNPQQQQASYTSNMVSIPQLASVGNNFAAARPADAPSSVKMPRLRPLAATGDANRVDSPKRYKVRTQRTLPGLRNNNNGLYTD